MHEYMCILKKELIGGNISNTSFDKAPTFLQMQLHCPALQTLLEHDMKILFWQRAASSSSTSDHDPFKTSRALWSPIEGNLVTALLVYYVPGSPRSMPCFCIWVLIIMHSIVLRLGLGTGPYALGSTRFRLAHNQSQFWFIFCWRSWLAFRMWTSKCYLCILGGFDSSRSLQELLHKIHGMFCVPRTVHGSETDSHLPILSKSCICWKNKLHLQMHGFVLWA